MPFSDRPHRPSQHAQASRGARSSQSSERARQALRVAGRALLGDRAAQTSWATRWSRAGLSKVGWSWCDPRAPTAQPTGVRTEAAGSPAYKASSGLVPPPPTLLQYSCCELLLKRVCFPWGHTLHPGNKLRQKDFVATVKLSPSHPPASVPKCTHLFWCVPT